MRVAILSDIHGNMISLNATLQQIAEHGGVDAYWFIGDYCALGYDPVGVLERITKLPNAVLVRGNTDHYTTTDNLPHPPVEHVQQNPQLVPLLVEIVRSFSWTRGMVTQAGWFDWLTKLPLEQRLTLPDGTRVLLVHAAPNTDDGNGVRRDHSDDDLRQILQGCDADLVFVGHTHIPLDKTVDGMRVVNIGALSNPHMPDLRACYVTLDANETEYTITQNYVDYDRQAVIDQLHAIKHPAADYLISYMRGKNVSDIFK